MENPEYPPCPLTIEQLRADKNLLLVEEVLNNLNCQAQDFFKTGDPLLYLNYDLNPNLKDFNFVLYFLKGFNGNKPDMGIEGFLNLPVSRNVWSFFAVSINYEIGQGMIYLKSFDTENNEYEK